ncbi:hypothetical protein [Sutcliffiella deserti]|uniref:hypothetical protein n=1 Tax=Sutcliffiella deserti TaxID=2875501 RepID=UPI001CC02F1A|nr:hypothetical protein [Sutcliffiella deserti]
MNSKNTILILSIFLNVVLGFLFYHETKKEGPVEVGLSFQQAIRTENYALAKTLMAEGRVEHISSETLKKVNEIMSAGTGYKTYELLEFDNGEMVLLDLTPNKEYEIQEVIIVPNELKSIFKY